MPGPVRMGWPRATVEHPVAFFYLLRFATWALALGLAVSEAAPHANRRYGEGLVLYTFLHLALGTAYVTLVRPRLVRMRPLPGFIASSRDLLAVGAADMLASLFVIHYSGGWGSPYWHFAVTSLLVPCFFLSYRWTVVFATVFSALYSGTLILSGDGLDGAWVGDERHIFTGFILTAYLVSLAVSYLGSVVRLLDWEKDRTRAALDDLGTLFDVTRHVMSAPADVTTLLQHVSQTIRDRRYYRTFAVYLADAASGKLEVAASTVGVEDLAEGASVKPGDGLVGSAAQTGVTQLSTQGPWRAAVPLRSGDELLGVMYAVSRGEHDSDGAARAFAEALANQIAVGVQNARLMKRQVEMAAQEERTRIAREIHDGIAQAMYALALNLETCADLAERDKGPLRDRLRQLVPLARQALLETRHYIFDLRPLLAGEGDLRTAIENQVKEFRSVSRIDTRLETTGDHGDVSVSVATGLYRILQEALANILKHSGASEVRVSLRFENGGVSLRVQDNGRGFVPDGVGAGYGLKNMRQRAESLGGTFTIEAEEGKGTMVAISLPAKEA
ncbi:MAG: sensor histidine kinase [Chloroflexi bacterium]|nr:sensor histidine kinase [Chloroflexota bacterium]